MVCFDSTEGPRSDLCKTGHAAARSSFPGCVSPSVERPAALLLGACAHAIGEFITHLPKLHVSLRLSDCPQVCLNLWSQSIAAQLAVVTLTSWCLVGTWQPGAFFLFYGTGDSVSAVCEISMPTTNTCIYYTATNKTEEPSGSADEIWKGSIFRHIRAQQAQSRGGEKTPCPKEMHGAIDRQWNKLAGHTGPQLLAQGQAWLCAWTFAALHKTCSCFTAREFSLPWWRDWLCHTTRHLQVTVPLLRGTHSIHCPGERAEMSEGQDRVLCALTSVPSSPCALRVVWVHRTFASIHFGLFLWWHFFPQLPVLREKQKDLPPSNNPLVSAAAANQRFRGKNKRACKSFY